MRSTHELVRPTAKQLVLYWLKAAALFEVGSHLSIGVF